MVFFYWGVDNRKQNVFEWNKRTILSKTLHLISVGVVICICYVLDSLLLGRLIFSDIPSMFHDADKNVNRKYIRHALILIFVSMDAYILLTPCIIFVSLNLSGVRINLSLIFSLILWCCKSIIRLSSQILVTYDM